MPPVRASIPRASIAPLLHESLGERVYRTVRDLILSQVFPPGSKLNVEQICRDLGVSRTPVWDTMRRLESEGLVNTVPRHGVFVLNYGGDQIRDLFMVRGALEALAVRQAARNLDADSRAALEATMAEMERAAAAGEMERYSRAAIDFHDCVLRAAGNRALNRLLENVYAQILVLRLRSLYLPERVESSVAEHRALFEAVISGDGERGERLARAHADHVLQDALEFIRRAEREPARDAHPRAGDRPDPVQRGLARGARGGSAIGRHRLHRHRLLHDRRARRAGPPRDAHARDVARLLRPARRAEAGGGAPGARAEPRLHRAGRREPLLQPRRCHHHRSQRVLRHRPGGRAGRRLPSAARGLPGCRPD